MTKGLVYKISGKLYDMLDEHAEKTRYASIRKIIAPRLKGKVLDAGCGTGRNFPYYLPATNVIAVDTNPRMLAIARQRAHHSKAKITIKQCNLKKLPFKENTFDAIIATFVLCVNNNKEAEKILGEMVRAAKKGAQLYFLEYVYPQSSIKKIFTKITALFPFLLYGLRYTVTEQAAKKNKSLVIEHKQLVYKDIVRLLIAKKIA